MEKPKRCIKFTGYIFLPMDESPEELKKQVTYGRIGTLNIYDEHNKKTTQSRFVGIGQMIDKLDKEFRKRTRSRLKKWGERVNTIDELLDGERDQTEVRKILTKDLTTRYNAEGLAAWDKNYAKAPSYRNHKHHYNELMVDKHIRVYEAAIQELEDK